MSEEIPAWLKAIQNGSLGEARAKAFLMDRFWILERSVDIEGADLIIQRRLTNKNLLDKAPPKLGFVQVKFLESEKTTHYIPTAYILDSEGKVREDFFLFLHTGYEEHAKVYFLTTDIVNSEFEIAEIDGVTKYRIGGTKILKTDKYLVKSNSATLSRIENRLELADFKKNREFISWKLPNIIAIPSAILPEYKEKIENSWGDIPEEFQRIKDNALKAMKDIEQIYLELKEIAEEVDPLEAFDKIEGLRRELGSSTYGRWGNDIVDNLYDQDFYYTCKNHYEKVKTLKKDGLLDDYINAKTILIERVVEFLTPNLPIDSNTIHSMIIKFSQSDFKIESINHKLINAAEYLKVPHTVNTFGHIEIPHRKYSGLNTISDDTFEYYWLAGRIGIKDEYKNNLPDFYRNHLYSVYRACLEKMYDLKYNE